MPATMPTRMESEQVREAASERESAEHDAETRHERTEEFADNSGSKPRELGRHSAGPACGLFL